MPRWHYRLAALLLPVALAALPACRVSNLRLWKPTQTLPGEGWEVETVPGICYWDDPRADHFRHRLDLFFPKSCRDFPVVMLVHGGAWMVGDNRSFGLYSSVGEFLASRGIGAVLPNYRLSPGVKHPEHVKDVARAFAWTHAHIAEYGGRPDQLFLAGHSAGGHLVSLLASDERYLKAEGLGTGDVRGVVAVSGVFCIPPDKVDLRVGGSSPDAVRLNEVLPLRGDRTAWCATGLPGLPLRLNIFGPEFGNDPNVRADASPLNHVRPGLPPFLLLTAEHEVPKLVAEARDFHGALVEQGGESQLMCVEGRNHNSIMFSACDPRDPVARAMVDFVRRHVDDARQ
jgi:acetyl esterase/lipase